MENERQGRLALEIGSVVTGLELIWLLQTGVQFTGSILLSLETIEQVLLMLGREGRPSSHTEFIRCLRGLVLFSAIVDCLPIWVHRINFLGNVGGEVVDCSLDPRCLLSHDSVLDRLDEVKLLEQPNHQLFIQG